MSGRLRVLADYDCYPLWIDADGLYSDIAPQRLPISRALAEELIRWSDEYDQALDRDDPASSGFPSDEAESMFVSKGRELAVRLRRELGDRWDITYYDQKLRKDVAI